MKTIKKFSFAVAMFVALTVSFSSCDAIADLASTEVEVEADPINFSVGGATQSPAQKVGAASEVVWIDQAIDISSKLNAELAKKKMSQKNVRNLFVIGSDLRLITGVSTSFIDFGNLKIYIDDVLVATASGYYTPTISHVMFNYPTPYDLFGKLGAGSVKLKITSDKAKPSIKFDFELYNTYKSKISALAL